MSPPGPSGARGETSLQRTVSRRGRVNRSLHRLRTGKQYAFMRRRAASYAGRYVVLKVALPQDDSPRVGYVVSRRHNRRAVGRNRSRRLLREAFRAVRPELKPAWIVLIPRMSMRDAKLGDVLPELRSLCMRAGLLTREKDRACLAEGVCR